MSNQVQQRPAALELRSSKVQSEPEHTLFVMGQRDGGGGGGGGGGDGVKLYCALLSS